MPYISHMWRCTVAELCVGGTEPTPVRCVTFLDTTAPRHRHGAQHGDDLAQERTDVLCVLSGDTVSSLSSASKEAHLLGSANQKSVNIDAIWKLLWLCLLSNR